MKETRTLEYKETISGTFLKSVSAFANYDGGTILFGVKDNGEHVGIANPEQTCLDIENKINDSINPQPSYQLMINHDTTISLVVKPGRSTPYLYKSKAYKRNDTATIEVDTNELTRLILKGTNRTYDELSSDNQNLQFSILEKRLMQETGIVSFDLNILKTLNLYSDQNGYNIAAEILSDENSLPGVDIARFGESISIIKNRKTVDHCSAIVVFDEAMKLFRENYRYEVIDGSTRRAIEMIPERAFREVIANSIIHRRWDVREHIRVMMFDDYVEISSPGGLPEGLSEAAFLSGDYSKFRNPILGGVFFRLNIVEMFGTGIRRVNESYENSISKPEFKVYEDSIKVILPVIKSKEDLSNDELAVYNAISDADGSKISEILESVVFGKSKTRNLLEVLIEKKLVYVTGSYKSTRYHKA